MHILLAEHQDVSQGAHDDAEIAVETGGVDIQEGYEPLRDADRSAAGSAAAVGRGEGLMQVEVHDVEAHVTRTHGAQERIHVGPVVIQQAAAIVHQGRDLLDIFLEEAQGVGVGHHDAGDVRTEQGLQVLHVDQAGRVGLDLHDLQAADGGAGRIRTVGAVRDDDLGAGQVSPGEMVFPQDHQARELTVRAGAGLEGEMLHPRDLRQEPVRPVQHGAGALHRLGILQGMQALEGGQSRELFVDLGIVFHRAAAERVEARIDAEIHLGQVGVVTHDVHLADFRQGRRFGTQERRIERQRAFAPFRGQRETGTARLRQFEYQFVVVLHDRSSCCMAATRSSNSAWPCFSVTQKLT